MGYQRAEHALNELESRQRVYNGGMWKWFFPYYQKTNVDDDLHIKMAVGIVLIGILLGFVVICSLIVWLISHFVHPH